MDNQARSSVTVDVVSLWHWFWGLHPYDAILVTGMVIAFIVVVISSIKERDE